MTTLALAQLVHGTPAFFQKLGQRFSDLAAGLHEARMLAQRFKTLSSLTDAQLAERGLKREEIPQAVMDYSVRV
jgi:hypothetical protein